MGDAPARIALTCSVGWPATGIEALYRNRRKDVLRWLEHHHGRDWRIFNFVPRFENVYPGARTQSRLGADREQPRIFTARSRGRHGQIITRRL